MFKNNNMSGAPQGEGVVREEKSGIVPFVFPLVENLGSL